MYYNIRVDIDQTGAKPFLFKWSSLRQNGWARAEHFVYCGGDKGTISGIKVKDGDYRKPHLVGDARESLA